MVPEVGFPVGMQDPHTNRVVGHYKWLPASTRQEDQTGLALCCHASFLQMAHKDWISSHLVSHCGETNCG